MTRKEKLLRIIDGADRELLEIREAEAKAREPEYLGKCFKYQQSGDESYRKSHYWYRYMMVLARKGPGFTGFSFERSDEDRIRICLSDTIFGIGTIGTTEISSQEFWHAWTELQQYITSAADRIRSDRGPHVPRTEPGLFE